MILSKSTVLLGVDEPLQICVFFFKMCIIYLDSHMKINMEMYHGDYTAPQQNTRDECIPRNEQVRRTFKVHRATIIILSTV